MYHPPTTILTVGQLKEVVAYFSQFDAFSFDVETIGPARGIPAQNEVAWLSLATHGCAVVIPMAHPIGNTIIGETTIPKVGKDNKTRNYKSPIWEPPPTQLRPSVVFSELADLFKSKRTKIAHNAVFDLVSVAKYLGFMPPPPYHDTIVSSWLLNENRLNGLKSRVKEDYGLDYDKENVGKQVEKFALHKVATYGRLDAQHPWLMYRRHVQALIDEDLTGVWQLEMDVLAVLLDMASVGVPISSAWLRVLQADLSEELVDRESAVYKAAGRVFNIGSPVQKAEVLYAPKKEGGQGLKAFALTPGGKKKKRNGAALDWADYSTDAASLKVHKKKNQTAFAILEYQETAKLLSTYVNAYLGDEENPSLIFNDRIYASFLQYGTVTGRFSSRNPNLQNIPIRTPAGAKIRRAFEAPEGYSLIVADYSQIELRIMAHFAGDGLLKQGFIDGIDAHQITAAGILDKDPSEVTDAERGKYGKTINFLIGFGGGAELLADKAEIRLREAEEVLEQHQLQFPEIYRFKKQVIRAALSRNPEPYVKTISGRKRHLPDLNARGKDFLLAERQAVNSVVQGSNGDLNKKSMIRAHRGFHEAGIADKARLILTVHDEIVTEAHNDVLAQAEAIVREAMIGEAMQILTVPITAGFEIVQDWSAAKK